MCAQTRPRFFLSLEKFLGNGVRTHVTSKGNIPATGVWEEGQLNVWKGDVAVGSQPTCWRGVVTNVHTTSSPFWPEPSAAVKMVGPWLSFQLSARLNPLGSDVCEEPSSSCWVSTLIPEGMAMPSSCGREYEQWKDANWSGTGTSHDHLDWPRLSYREQFKEGDEEADRGNDGKTTSKSGLVLNGIYYYQKLRTTRSGGSWL